MASPTSLEANLEALERFRRRRPFHDHPIDEIVAINKRVLIRLNEWTLVVTGATQLTRCETPAGWIRESLTVRASRLHLEVETDEGRIHVVGDDLRLIRNVDLALLIPPIDA